MCVLVSEGEPERKEISDFHQWPISGCCCRHRFALKQLGSKSPHGLTIRANDVNVIPDTAELLVHPRFIRFCTNAPIHNMNYVKLMNIKARFRISDGP